MTRLRLLALMALTLVIVGAFLRPSAQHRGAAEPAAATGELNNRLVLAISVDGLTRRALNRMGPKQLPNIHRLLNRGVSTRNARTEPEKTVTLPNHVGMVTGRRIDTSAGGHGVTWNDDRPDLTVHDAAGEWVDSIFARVHAAGGTTAVFAAKSKFSILERSWPDAVHRSVIRHRKDLAVVRALRRHLRQEKPTFTFLHLGAPDRVGHAHGWMSRPYKRAVRNTDARIGKVLLTRGNHRQLRRQLAIVFTSDHGGVSGTKGHYGARKRANNTVPFAIFAKYVDKGTNIYRLSPSYVRPRKACWCTAAELPPAQSPQPVRNGDVANLSLDILGLGPLDGSLWGYDQQLSWRR